MVIDKIKINSFGSLRDREFTFTEGLNIIEGNNESGKTALAMFIKFAFYGLSGRSSEEYPQSERKRFVNWDTGAASGELFFTFDGKKYKIERNLSVSADADNAPVRERKTIVELETGGIINKGEEPGEVFFGVPENIFVNTVFVRQAGSNQPDTSGVCTAIENILSSGDESVDVKKALARLDAVRKNLKHKKADGGEIPEMIKKISQCERELQEAQQKSEALIGAQSALERAEADIAILERDCGRAKEILAIYSDIEAVRLRTRLDSVDKALEEKKKRLIEMNEKFSPKEKEGEISAARSQLVSCNKGIEAAEERIGEIGSMLGVSDMGDVSEVRRECDRLITKRRRIKGLSRVFGVFSLLSCACAVAMYAMKIDSFLIPSGLCAVLIILFVVTTVLQRGAKKECEEIFAEWEAESYEEFLSSVALYEKKEAQNAEIQAEKQVLSQNIARYREEISDIADEMHMMCIKLGLSPEKDGSAEEYISMAEEYVKNYAAEIEEIKHQAIKDEENCRILTQQVCKYDYTEIARRRTENESSVYWDEAERMTAEESMKLRRVLEFNEEKLKSQRERRASYREALAEGRAGMKSPSALTEKLGYMRNSLEKMNMRFEAVRLAMDTLETASENLRSQVIPRIIGGASARFSRMTDGRYDSLGIGRDFSVSYGGEGGTHEGDYLSGGSADGAYVCLRLSLADVLYGKRNPPSVFDECFAQVDGDRLKRILKMQSDEEGQSLVFTCRSLEGVIAPYANLIRMN